MFLWPHSEFYTAAGGPGVSCKCAPGQAEFKSGGRVGEREWEGGGRVIRLRVEILSDQACPLAWPCHGKYVEEFHKKV